MANGAYGIGADGSAATASTTGTENRRSRQGRRLVVVTLGPDGCYYDAGYGCGWVSGVPVSVVDTLGAGDAFVAGLLAGLAARDGSALDDEAMLIRVLPFANAVGSITTTRYGAIPALPTRQEVEALL